MATLRCSQIASLQSVFHAPRSLASATGQRESLSSDRSSLLSVRLLVVSGCGLSGKDIRQALKIMDCYDGANTALSLQTLQGQPSDFLHSLGQCLCPHQPSDSLASDVPLRL